MTIPSGLLSQLGLLGLRSAYFLLCRRFLNHSVLTNLKNAPSASLLPLRQLSHQQDSIADSHSHSHSHSRSKIILAPSPQPHQHLIASTIAPFLFCWSFCEGALLFSIVILGSWIDPFPRNLNWNLSLGLLISDVVFIVPFLECLLFSTSILSRKSNERVRLLSARTLGFTLVPFTLYLIVYYRVGQTMQGLLGVESGLHSFGFLNTTLARICVPGVVLIASLSGGGAVNTAWETFEWRRREREPPVTDQTIALAETSLLRTRVDMEERKTRLVHQQQHQKRESPTGTSAKDGGNGAKGILGLFSGSSKTASLEQEIAGLEAMERQMSSDLSTLKERKEYLEYSRTVPGVLLNVANWCLSVYCVYRLFMACVNLVFGYVRRPSAPGSGVGNPTTDVVTYLLATVLRALRLELELAKLSRLVGLVLIGSIILVNLRGALVWVHRVSCRVGSRGVSGALMLLVLGQLMAMYLLTCLISLPSSGPPPSASKPSSSTSELLATLPSFSRFSRLFDIIFLSAGSVTFLIRWVGKQVGWDVGAAQGGLGLAGGGGGGDVDGVGGGRGGGFV